MRVPKPSSSDSRSWRISRKTSLWFFPKCLRYPALHVISSTVPSPKITPESDVYRPVMRSNLPCRIWRGRGNGVKIYRIESM